MLTLKVEGRSKSSSMTVILYAYLKSSNMIVIFKSCVLSSLLRSLSSSILYGVLYDDLCTI